jgi:hypothetical protein
MDVVTKGRELLNTKISAPFYECEMVELLHRAPFAIQCHLQQRYDKESIQRIKLFF